MGGGGDSEVLRRLDTEIAQLNLSLPLENVSPCGHQLALLQEALKTEHAFASFGSKNLFFSFTYFVDEICVLVVCKWTRFVDDVRNSLSSPQLRRR